MNDDELLTTVRERTQITMTVPIEQILRRGSVIRGRRRASALAILTAVIVGAIALLPLSNPSREGMRLAAWTVLKDSDGTVKVTVRELQDPGGLQSALRAAGVPASVIFGDQTNPCQSYGGRPGLLSKVFTPSAAPGQPQENMIAVVIHRTAIPNAAGVQIISNQTSVGLHLVIAGQGCTD